MRLVRAGLDVNVQQPAAGAAELRAHRVGLCAKLGNRIGRRTADEARLARKVRREAVVVYSVENIVVLLVAHSVGAEAPSYRIPRPPWRPWGAPVQPRP